jgi:hypothetical protein
MLVSRLNLHQSTRHINPTQPNIVPVQNISLGRGVIQNPSQHSIPKRQVHYWRAT